MNLQGKHVLITGATGFIGGALARRLHEDEGVQVRALVRTPAKAQALADMGVEVVEGDITGADSVRSAMAGCQIVFHAAAYVGESGRKEDVWAVNVEGTRLMAAAAVEAGIERFVQLSSCAVYGSLQQMDIDERVATRMTGRVYHDSKVAAEEVVFDAHRQQGLPVVVARPSQVYGPGSPQFTIRVIEAVKQGKVVLVDGGRHHFKPVYIDNLVDGLIACAGAEAAVGEALNLTDGYVVTWRQFFQAYGNMVGVSNFRSAPYELRHARGLVQRDQRRPARPAFQPQSGGGAHLSQPQQLQQRQGQNAAELEPAGRIRGGHGPHRSLVASRGLSRLTCPIPWRRIATTPIPIRPPQTPVSWLNAARRRQTILSPSPICKRMPHYVTVQLLSSSAPATVPAAPLPLAASCSAISSPLLSIPQRNGLRSKS